MKIHELSPAPGSKKQGKRLGRGTGSGLGKTSGKGHKGQWARSGGGVRPGFEGGQNPLHRRLPKIGFKNRLKKDYNILNLIQLEKLDEGAEITLEYLLEKGIIRKASEHGLKVLGYGKLSKRFTVKAQKFSKKAKEAILASGGTVEELGEKK